MSALKQNIIVVVVVVVGGGGGGGGVSVVGYITETNISILTVLSWCMRFLP